MNKPLREIDCHFCFWPSRQGFSMVQTDIEQQQDLSKTQFLIKFHLTIVKCDATYPILR